MILATALAFGMAWKTKDLKIDSRFSDTNAVFLAIASQLQAWFGKSASYRWAHRDVFYAWYQCGLTTFYSSWTSYFGRS
jgi:hypothetical protein